ncbi:recombinase family protein [Kocuria oceani]|uniref:recombinase family protein n=1 Tax=Kocuria oceani TaxID=988827 RepID=UPI004035B1CD
MATTTAPASGPAVETTQGGHLIGYARVSTTAQSLDLQLATLTEYGIHPGLMFSDKLSGKNVQRPGLSAALEACKAGDTLVVAKLDRLGRNLADMVRIVTELTERGVGFLALDRPEIDTTSAHGRFVFSIFGALAEFEREQILERTAAGRAAADAAGKKGGRAKRMESPAIRAKVLEAHKLRDDHGLNAQQIARQLGVSVATAYRYLDTSSKPQSR